MANLREAHSIRMGRRALIIGAGGQDGTLLTERLTADGYSVCGVTRSAVTVRSESSTAIDLLDAAAVAGLVRDQQPDEIYYLAAFHHSSEGSRPPGEATLFHSSFTTHVHGLVNTLDAIRVHASHGRLLYAASAHVFGDPATTVQTERTPLSPNCPYGISKVAGIYASRYFYERHRVFASVAILYNHESPLRRADFVSQKIIRAARELQRGERKKLILGDLTAEVDWGYAPDYVDAMRLIVGLRTPETLVVATGELHSVREFVELVFGMAGLDWRQYVEQDPSILATRRRRFCGDATRLRSLTGWSPTVTFEQMVRRLWEASDSHATAENRQHKS